MSETRCSRLSCSEIDRDAVDLMYGKALSATFFVQQIFVQVMLEEVKELVHQPRDTSWSRQA